jgi:hypothetical protein
MEMRTPIIGLAICGAFVVGYFARGGDTPATTRPTTNPTTQGWRVVEIVGLVRYRPGPDEPWTAPLPGMITSEDGEIRTGPRSRFVVERGGERRVLDRLGIISVHDFSKSPTTTDASLRYGRVRYDIVPDEKDDAIIRSPSTTLPVRH